MENIIKEKHRLPLTFKYIETINKKSSDKIEKENIIYFIRCTKYQTDYYVREKPVKPLTRML